MSYKHPIIVPYWVATAFSRKKVSLNKCLDYATVRDILAIEDVAAFLNLQQLHAVPFIKENYFGHLLSSWESSVQPELRKELDSTIVPLSYSEGSKERNLLRLSKDYIDPDQPNQSVFELIDFERDSYALVLNPGFTEDVAKHDTQLSLVKAMLKISYVYSNVNRVSSENVFKTYVKLLSDVVWGRVTA